MWVNIYIIPSLNLSIYWFASLSQFLWGIKTFQSVPEHHNCREKCYLGNRLFNFLGRLCVKGSTSDSCVYYAYSLLHMSWRASICPWKAASKVGVMPSSSAVFRSFLVASFKRSKYPSIAALWYLDIFKRNRKGSNKSSTVFHLPLHFSRGTGWHDYRPEQTMWSLGVNVSAAPSHKTKAKSSSLVLAAQFT